MFDKVLFLGQGGRTVYSGSVGEAETYFRYLGYPLPPYVNPADFYMDVIAGTIENERNVYINLFDEWENYQMKVDEVGSEEDKPKREVEMTEIGSLKSDVGTLDSNTPMIKKTSSQIIIKVQEIDTMSTEGMFCDLYLFKICFSFAYRKF